MVIYTYISYFGLQGGNALKQKLEQLQLEIGRGSNRFSMQRGSFQYKQKTEWSRRLTPAEIRTTADGFDKLYRDPKTGKEWKISARQEGNRWRVKCIPPKVSDANRFTLTFPAAADAHYYGCGETYAKFDLKGENVRIWVAEHQNTRRISGKLIREKVLGKRPNHVLPFDKYESYYAQPTFISSEKYYLHADVPGYAEFDFSAAEKVTLRFQQCPELVLEQAEDYPALMQGLSGLLGHPPALPEWLFEGGILAVQEGCDAVDRRVTAARKAGAVINAVWCQDWCGCRRTGFGYQVMWNWVYDPSIYPELPARIAEWKKQDIRFLGYINPFIALEKELYREAAEKGYCVKDKDGKDYLVTITTFPAAMVDFTNPAAWDWYKGIIKKNMIGIGMSGWMADFGEYLPVDSVLYSGEDPALLHNRWPALWAQLNREAVEECGAQDEVFFFTRAGSVGTIANSPMMWTGDQHVDWSVDDGLPSVIPATLSLAMSGYGIAHADAGGYTTVMTMRRSKELLLRWMELSALSPLFRTHEGNQPVNNVQVDADEETLAQLGKMTRLHAALGPKLKEWAALARTEGTPVMRPLFWQYDEPEAYTEKTEFLLGPDLLVAPVCTEKAVFRRVWLPKDEWQHLFTGKKYSGGIVTVEAPIGQPPVFVRCAAAEQYKGLIDI